MKIRQHFLIRPVQRLKSQPQSLKKSHILSEMPAVEKQQKAFYVRIVFGQKAGESVAYRMGVVDNEAIRLPTLAAPADILFAQLTKAWIRLQVFPESTLQKQMPGVVSFRIRQCQLSVDNRCDAQFGNTAQILEKPTLPQLARTVRLRISGNETRRKPETQIESIHESRLAEYLLPMSGSGKGEKCKGKETKGRERVRTRSIFQK